MTYHSCGDVDIKDIGQSVSAKDIDPVTMLRAQLNRFADARSPAKYRLFATPLPATGPLDLTVAARAGVVMVMRTRETIGELDPKYFALVSAIQFDTTGEVLRANLSQVLGIVTTYADAHSLPAASIPGRIFGLPTYVIAAGALAVAFLLTRKRER